MPEISKNPANAPKINESVAAMPDTMEEEAQTWEWWEGMKKLAMDHDTQTQSLKPPHPDVMTVPEILTFEGEPDDLERFLSDLECRLRLQPNCYSYASATVACGIAHVDHHVRCQLARVIRKQETEIFKFITNYSFFVKLLKHSYGPYGECRACSKILMESVDVDRHFETYPDLIFFPIAAPD